MALAIEPAMGAGWEGYAKNTIGLAGTSNSWSQPSPTYWQYVGGTKGSEREWMAPGAVRLICTD